MTRLAEVIDVLQTAYPPQLAASWDAVGLVCGDPGAAVSRVMFAVDATEAVIEEAVAWEAQALVVHHPLLLRGVDTVAANTPKGALIHRLIREGCGLFTAHTNADAANPGVSDALAAAIGVTVSGPLDPAPAPAVDLWTVQVPGEAVERVLAALFAAGAGEVGDYREAAFRIAGTGQFRPLDGAHPAIGEVGALERVSEEQIQVVAAPGARTVVAAALRAAHPYEEPAYHVSQCAELESRCGTGRVGELPETVSLREFTTSVANALPATSWGVRAAGDPDRPIRTVAVCGGAGDSLLAAATRRNVDVFLTADLRHHPADEHLRRGGPALVDAAHWATEFPWCAQVEALVHQAFPRVQTRISQCRTDPWTIAARQDGQ